MRAGLVSGSHRPATSNSRHAPKALGVGAVARNVPRAAAAHSPTPVVSRAERFKGASGRSDSRMGSGKSRLLVSPTTTHNASTPPTVRKDWFASKKVGIRGSSALLAPAAASQTGGDAHVHHGDALQTAQTTSNSTEFTTPKGGMEKKEVQVGEKTGMKENLAPQSPVAKTPKGLPVKATSPISSAKQGANEAAGKKVREVCVAKKTNAEMQAEMMALFAEAKVFAVECPRKATCRHRTCLLNVE